MSSDNQRFPAQQFAIEAQAEVGVLIRVLQPLAKLDLVPHRLEAEIAGDNLLIRMEFSAMAGDWARKVAAGLRQVPNVRSVVTSERAEERSRVATG